MSVSTRAYAAESATVPLAPLIIERREITATDVAIDILFCGVCHSDLHQSRNEWGISKYPVVPGHEIVGRVRQVGTAVAKFRQGDLVAVGVLYDSCRLCTNCTAGIEQYCIKGATETYNSPDRRHGGITRGGYSEAIVVDEAYVFRVPKHLDPASWPLVLHFVVLIPSGHPFPIGARNYRAEVSCTYQESQLAIRVSVGKQLNR